MRPLTGEAVPVNHEVALSCLVVLRCCSTVHGSTTRGWAWETLWKASARSRHVQSQLRGLPPGFRRQAMILAIILV